ncbi:MAG: DUF4365 domain-containing protein, partial [Fibrella sp.]|nr:DUF4365 domain-containing protein [Armatimonadota bacterium]
KATDKPDYRENGRFLSVRLDASDIGAWRREYTPLILVVYDAIKQQAFWIHFQAATDNRSKTFLLPTTQSVDEAAVRTMQTSKTIGFRSTTMKAYRDITYRLLADALKQNGFSEHSTERYRHFAHENGAEITWGAVGDEGPVQAMHYTAAQSTVDYYDILRRDAFDLLMMRLSGKQLTATSVS